MLKLFTGPYAMLAKFGTGLLIFAVLAFGVWRWLDSYGDRRYKEGVAATDMKWEKASAALKAQAAQSAGKADDAAANRLTEHLAQATKEQEKVDDAIANGSSPLDVLFGG